MISHRWPTSGICILGPMRFSQHQYSVIQDIYLLIFPADIPPEILREYKTVIAYKYLIRNATPNETRLTALVDMVLKRLTENRRFQRLTLLKLIRHHSEAKHIDPKTMSGLFQIFQAMIISAKDDVGWKLSVSLKDKVLAEEHISWLLDHYSDSEHIQNRLLRYPVKHRKISSWAKHCIEHNIHPTRLSELISLRLNFSKRFTHVIRPRMYGVFIIPN